MHTSGDGTSICRLSWLPLYDSTLYFHTVRGPVGVFAIRRLNGPASRGRDSSRYTNGTRNLNDTHTSHQPPHNNSCHPRAPGTAAPKIRLAACTADVHDDRIRDVDLEPRHAREVRAIARRKAVLRAGGGGGRAVRRERVAERDLGGERRVPLRVPLEHLVVEDLGRRRPAPGDLLQLDRALDLGGRETSKVLWHAGDAP